MADPAAAAPAAPETHDVPHAASRGGAMFGTAHVFHMAVTSALLLASTLLLIGGWYVFGLVMLAAAVGTTLVNFSGE